MRLYSLLKTALLTLLGLHFIALASAIAKDAKDFEFENGPYCVNAKPKLGEEFQICVASFYAKADKNLYTVSGATPDGDRICPEKDRFFQKFEQKSKPGKTGKNSGRNSKLVGDGPNKASWGGRRWTYMEASQDKGKDPEKDYFANPASLLQFLRFDSKGEESWDGVCIAHVETDDDPKNRETSILVCDYKGADIKEDGTAYLHCPKSIQECYDTRFELIKPKAIGDNNGVARTGNSDLPVHAVNPAVKKP